MMYNELPYYSKAIYDLTNEEKKILVSMIENEYSNHYLIFRASGLWNNIQDIKLSYKNYIIEEFLGDKNKFLTKRFPEIHFLFKKVSYINEIFTYF